MTQLLLGAIFLLVGSLKVTDSIAFGAGLSLGIPQRAKPRIYRHVRQIIRAENSSGLRLPERPWLARYCRKNGQEKENREQWVTAPHADSSVMR